MRGFIKQLSMLCYLTIGVGAMTTVYMDDNCGKTFIVDDSVRIVSSRGGYLTARMACNIFLISNSKDTNELVHIRTFNMTCALGFLTLYDGKGIIPDNAVASGYCLEKTKLPMTVFNSTLHGFTLQLTTLNWNFYAGFDVLVTSYFKDGPCSTREYQCSNTWCIGRNLQCDGFDNCGDGSDEAHCPAGGALSVHPSGSLVVPVLLLMTVVYSYM